MASLLQPPLNRDDIVSTILNDYIAMGEDLEWNRNISPVIYEPVPPPKDGMPFVPAHLGGLPSVTSKNAALASMMGPFQLRVTASRSSSPASITSRSISRNSKPSSLKLKTSNGSTAGSATPPLSDFPLETIDLEIANQLPSIQSIRGRTTDRSVSDSLLLETNQPPPRVPPRSTERKHVGEVGVGRVQRLVEMGNKASKVAPENDGAEDEESSYSSTTSQLKSVLKTRMGNRPTLADAMANGNRKGRPEQKSGRGSLLSEISSKVGHRRTDSGGPDTMKSRSTAISRDTPPSVAKTDDTKNTDQTVIRHSPPAATEPEPSLSGGSESAADDGAPPTPIKKPILPPPSPLKRENPTDYGLAEAGRIKLDTPPADTESIRQGLHSRGKSSTGLAIFGQTASTKNVSTFLRTITPSPSPSPIVPDLPATLHTSKSHPILSPLRSPRSSRGQTSTTTSQKTITPSTAAMTAGRTMSRRPSSRPATLPNLSALNASRPPYTIAPPITAFHLNCYHSHSKFHHNRNLHCPVPCVLCYSEEGERHACWWCGLRICKPCLDDLNGIQGRDLGVFLTDGEALRGRVDRVSSGMSKEAEEKGKKKNERKKRRSTTGALG